MVTRRPPRPLPGTDPLLPHKGFLIFFLGLAAAVVALGAATAATIGARGGHLPWPLAQWALATPLGTLVVALVGGLAVGLPFLLAAPAGFASTHAVDVTELPPTVWPRPLPPWRRPGGPTPAEYWLGRGRRQRALSLLALALAVLLVLASFAAYVAVAWYGLAHLPDCSGSRCPPTYGQLQGPPMVIGFAIMYLGHYRWARHVERRCGIWFRAPVGTLGGLTCYVRRPGVTAEAAAAALARYTRDVERPAARRALAGVLLAVPFFLVLIALGLLSTWLPTQWIPA